jgi:hypothetical protein
MVSLSYFQTPQELYIPVTQILSYTINHFWLKKTEVNIITHFKKGTKLCLFLHYMKLSRTENKRIMLQKHSAVQYIICILYLKMLPTWWPCSLRHRFWPLICCDCEFESHSGHGCLSLCLYVVLSCVGRGLYDKLITHPKESYHVSIKIKKPKKGGQGHKSYRLWWFENYNIIPHVKV